MLIANNNYTIQKIQNINSKNTVKKPLIPQSFDSVSFSGNKLQKSSLDGFDYFCNDTFKFPLEKMSNIGDFRSVVRQKTSELFKKTYPTKRDDREKNIENARSQELKKWDKYLQTLALDEPKYVALGLIAANGIVKNLKPNNEAIPPVLNEKVFEQTARELERELLKDKTAGFNFMERYEENLKTYYLEKAEKENFAEAYGDGFWVKIPSEPNTDIGGEVEGETEDERYQRFDEQYEKDFEENVNMMRVLSHKNWCTSSLMASVYLGEGDFHIFMENSKPKFALRFEGGEIVEIEEVKNDRKINVESARTINKYIEKNNFRCGHDVNVDEDFLNFGAELAEPAKNKDYFTIFEKLGFEPEVLENGKLAINGYNKGFYDGSLRDFGIDENEMFKNVEIIKGDVTLENTDIESLGSVGEIWGDLNCENSKLNDLGNVRKVRGSVNLKGSEVTRLKYLTEVGGSLYLQNSQVKRLDYLQSVGKDLHFENSKFEQTGRAKITTKDGIAKVLPKFERLKNVGGNIFISKNFFTEQMDKELWQGALGTLKLV